MSEFDTALQVANSVLDRPYADPDDDLAILARQLLRAREREARLVAGLQAARDELDRLGRLVWKDTRTAAFDALPIAAAVNAADELLSKELR